MNPQGSWKCKITANCTLRASVGCVIFLTSCFGLAWINARYPLKWLYHCPFSAGQGRENMMKGSRVDTRTGRDHSSVTVTDKTD